MRERNGELDVDIERGASAEPVSHLNRGPALEVIVLKDPYLHSAVQRHKQHRSIERIAVACMSRSKRPRVRSERCFKLVPTGRQPTRCHTDLPKRRAQPLHGLSVEGIGSLAIDRRINDALDEPTIDVRSDAIEQGPLKGRDR